MAPTNVTAALFPFLLTPANYPPRTVASCLMSSKCQRFAQTYPAFCAAINMGSVRDKVPFQGQPGYVASSSLKPGDQSPLAQNCDSLLGWRSVWIVQVFFRPSILESVWRLTTLSFSLSLRIVPVRRTGVPKHLCTCLEEGLIKWRQMKHAWRCNRWMFS